MKEWDREECQKKEHFRRERQKRGVQCFICLLGGSLWLTAVFQTPTQIRRAATTPGGSSTATATVTSAGDTRGRTQRKTAGNTTATWRASTARPSRTLSEVSRSEKEGRLATGSDTAMETGPTSVRSGHFCSSLLTCLSVAIENSVYLV